MNEEIHKRAERLILEARVEGVTEADRRWLEDHLASCEPCARRSHSTEETLRGLRAVSVRLDPSLLTATRLRVELRLQQLRDERQRLWALRISCALSWLLGVASAPLVWRTFEWLGEKSRLPALVWEAGFVLWWLVPASATAAILVWHRSRAAGEEQSRAPEVW